MVLVLRTRQHNIGSLTWNMQYFLSVTYTFIKNERKKHTLHYRVLIHKYGNKHSISLIWKIRIFFSLTFCTSIEVWSKCVLNYSTKKIFIPIIRLPSNDRELYTTSTMCSLEGNSGLSRFINSNKLICKFFSVIKCTWSSANQDTIHKMLNHSSKLSMSYFHNGCQD